MATQFYSIMAELSEVFMLTVNPKLTYINIHTHTYIFVL